jgi:hypothetical protein
LLAVAQVALCCLLAPAAGLFCSQRISRLIVSQLQASRRNGGFGRSPCGAGSPFGQLRRAADARHRHVVQQAPRPVHHASCIMQAPTPRRSFRPPDRAPIIEHCSSA